MVATRRNLLIATALAGAGSLALQRTPRAAADACPVGPALTHMDAEWRSLLSPAAYGVLRQSGTEAPFSSPLDEEVRPGTYDCAGCGLLLFLSSTKYDSRTGWPSFWKPIGGAVSQRADNSFGVSRTEIGCTRCAGHLGHVFADGPRPTGCATA